MSILDAPIARLDGTAATLGEITGGKPALLVNVASKCGLTSQYAALEQIHEKYADRGFTVVGVPCNQFGGQEPGTSEEIAEFCSATYGVTFPMTEKIRRRPAPDLRRAGHDAQREGLRHRHRVELREVPARRLGRDRGPLPGRGAPRRPTGAVGHRVADLRLHQQSSGHQPSRGRTRPDS